MSLLMLWVYCCSNHMVYLYRGFQLLFLRLQRFYVIFTAGNWHPSVGIISELQTRTELFTSECAPSILATRIKRKIGSGWREMQQALSLKVRVQNRYPRYQVTPFMSQRGGSSHSGFPYGPPSATTTASAACSPIQLATVTTSAGSWFHFHKSLYCNFQQTGGNPKPSGECHKYSILANSHHAIPELELLGKVSSMMVEKCIDAYGDGLVTMSISVPFLVLLTCFCCTKASAYQVAHWQTIKQAAREVYCLFDCKTGRVTDRPLPGLGPKRQLFCTTSHIERGTSSWSISNSGSIPYRHKHWYCMPLNNSNFAGKDIYWLRAMECVPALQMNTRIIHILLINWILQLLSWYWRLWRW